MATLKEGMEKLTAMMVTMMAEKAHILVLEPIPTVVVSLHLTVFRRHFLLLLVLLHSLVLHNLL